MSTTTNPNFDPQHSTYHIWRGDLMEQCLEDDLVEIEEALAAIGTDKAPTSHTHEQSSITGLIAALAAKANATHDHTLAQIVGLAALLAEKADLVDGKIPAAQLPASMDEVIDGTLVSSTVFNNTSGAAVTPSSGKVYQDTTTNFSYRWSGSAYVRMDEGVALGETSSTAHRGDHGKVAYEHSQDSTVHVTAGQKTAWDGKAAGDHVHQINAIPGLLDMLLTDTAGRQQVTIAGDVLTTIAGMAAGVRTAYSAGGSSATATNAPNTIESWRYLIHKNYVEYGWVLAMGSEGSFFINYIDGGNWRGWKAIWDNNPAALWSGAYYMNANQTIYPSKKLSECRTGWILLWSDYDTVNGGATNGDVFASYVPKRCYSGGNWSGHSWLVDIPIEASASAESRCIKKVYMWDNRIVGNAINEALSRNDVVLRAVYEF